MKAIRFLLFKTKINRLICKQTILEVLIYAYLIYSVGTLNKTLMLSVDLNSLYSVFCVGGTLVPLLVLLKSTKTGFWTVTLQDRQRLLTTPIQTRYKLLYVIIKRISTTVKIIIALCIPFAIFLKSVAGKTIVQWLLVEFCLLFIVIQYYLIGLILSLIGNKKAADRYVRFF